MAVVPLKAKNEFSPLGERKKVHLGVEWSSHANGLGPRRNTTEVARKDGIIVVGKAEFVEHSIITNGDPQSWIH